MILVIGATGRVGGAAVRQLREKDLPVRAFVRDPRKARLPDGVDVAQGDLSDIESLRSALKGVDDVFLVWGALELDPTPVIEVIAGNAQRVIHLSTTGVDETAEEQGDPITEMHARIERQIKASGLRRTTVRGGGFASNDLDWAPQSKAGDVVRDPFPKARRSVVHEADLAEVAVLALTADGHDGQIYPVTGPTMLSTDERIAIISEVTGSPLRVEEQPHAEARAELIAAGIPPEFVDGILEAHIEFSSPDYHETISPSTLVTGTPARDYHQWVRDHIEEFR